MKPKREESAAQRGNMFPETRWSVVLRARDESTIALNTLCECYRKPLLIWLQCRQRDFSPLEPEELVNGFFAAKLEERFLKSITRGPAKFRSFLLECLRNYAISEWRKARAQIRGGGRPHQPLEQSDEEGRTLFEPVSADPAADEAYDKAWGRALLANAIARLERELAAKGHLPLWQDLQPHLYAEEHAPGYDEIAKRFGLSKNAVYTAAHRLRERLKTLIHEELRQTVATQEAFEEERNRFLGLFGASGGPGATR